MMKSGDFGTLSDTTVSGRLKIIQQLLKIRSVAAFATEIGVDTSVLNNIISPHGRQGKPSFDTLQKIAAKYPRVNIDWLVTGKGEPLRPFTSLTPEIIPLESEKKKLQHIHQPVPDQDGQCEPSAEELEGMLKICQEEKDNLQKIIDQKNEQIEMLQKLNSASK